ncbi:MAG: hypothetical protein NZ602_10365 [Thermoguttaceae bacterium]|nr:hypothetical protein [Thermoguttaceae bacterium]MDW8036459.1 hypothetical protein [Thermoguttaceae bacterium]
MAVLQRRHFLQAGMGALVWSVAGRPGLPKRTAALALGAEFPPMGSEPKEKLRDRFWIFTVYAGGDNQGWGLPRPSRMTPAEAAFYLGVPNLLFIRSDEQPPLDQFEQWAIPFRPLKRVVWSLVGSGGKTAQEERRRALELPKRFPNIVGFIMDDFFRSDGSGALSPTELQELQKHLKTSDRKLDLYVVLYTHQLHLPVQKYLEFCDKITLWTWHSKDLVELQRNFERLEKLAPRHGKLLGCYLWDYGAKAPMPLDRMIRQCQLGLQWLKAGRVEGMIFLGNTTCDLELESVEWTRTWIAEVGDQPL